MFLIESIDLNNSLLHQITLCQIRDYQREGEPEQQADTAVHRSSLAFSIMCAILTVIYAGFAGLLFAWSRSLLQEMASDDDLDDNATMAHHQFNHHHKQPNSHHFVVGPPAYNGYIGERFDVRTAGFVSGPTVGSNGGTMT